MIGLIFLAIGEYDLVRRFKKVSKPGNLLREIDREIIWDIGVVFRRNDQLYLWPI